MSNLKCSMAQFKTLIKNLPELIFVFSRATSHVYKIDSNHTLIEATIILLTLYPILCVSHILSSSVRR